MSEDKQKFHKQVHGLCEMLLHNSLFKVIVTLITLSLIIFGVWGGIKIQSKFEFLSLIPEESYLRQWAIAKEHLYPNIGWRAEVYTGPLNTSNLPQVEKLTQSFQELEDSGVYIKSRVILGF